MHRLTTLDSRGRVAIATLIGTAYLVLIVSLTWKGGWPGYAAGIGDHTVLLPQGIQWAIPDAFENDWFIKAAPQPHWFFDIIVAAGTATHTLDLLLVVFWVLGFAAYTLATVLVAKIVAPGHPLLASLLVLTITGITPWMLFGTGTPNIGMALPTVFTTSLIYLVFVLLIRGDLRSAAILATISAATHVQQGAIVAVVFAATLLVQWLLQRRLPLALLLGFIGSTAFVIFGLRLRPVAANLSDFVEVCDTIIPYHCSAWTWAPVIKLGVVGGLLLAALTALACERRQRITWGTSIGLVVLGLGLGFIFDARRVPVLGELAQAVNVYRLGAVVVPFMIWGMLLPLLKIRAFPRLLRRPLGRVGLWAVWGVGVALTFLDPSWGVFPSLLNGHRALAICVALAFLLLVAVSLIWRRRTLPIAVSVSLVFSAVLSSAMSGGFTTRPNFTWTSAPTQASVWLEEAKSAVPPGAVITAPGDSASLRLVTQRATIVDCKNVPYGGKAWAEWKQRIADLGDCMGNTDYADVYTVEDYTELAEKYGSNYIVLPPNAIERNSAQIEQAGWTELVAPIPGVEWTLYRISDR